ncbi:phage tail-collar fiber domain-containing protein [Stutzerimonas nitrititolerans]|uniref:phage tail-collar fiber domain-containing protein n=1 Tax=Stutzerimonas nitrititolerans TaxID=2482751 RepID=UPI003F8122D9
MALPITITDAGRAEIINAQNTGTGPVTITEIGFGTGQYTPTKTRTALQAQVKRVSSIAGQAVAADTIHVMAKDESSDTYNVGEFGLFSDKGTLIAVYSQPAASGWIIQKAGPSTLLLATDIILESLDATSIAFGDILFINPPATETVAGVTMLVNNLTSSRSDAALTAAMGKKLNDEKEPAIAPGTAGQYWRGNKTWRDFATDVRAAVLSGLSIASATAVAATDSLLTAIGKLQAQITGLATSKLDINANAVSATKLQNARTIGGVAFDGSANINLPGVNQAGNQNTSGNAASATKLQSARTINGVAFDGASDIEVYDKSKIPLSGALGVGSTRFDNRLGILKGVDGGYGPETDGSTFSWGGPIYGIGPNHTGQGLGASFTPENMHGLAWLRPANTSIDDAVGEGAYIYRAGNFIGGVGVAGIKTSGIFSGNGSGITALNASYLASGTIPDGRLSGTYNGFSITGNAATATKLQSARTIGGVSFDGTANINLPGVNQAGNQNTSGNAASATKLQSARTIGGVSFDGTANINLPGVNQAGNQNTSGNAASATKLQFARTINGVAFDGTANISLPDTGLGIGQTWQDVTSSRDKNVIYTNTTGKAIQLQIIFDSATPSYFAVNNISSEVSDNTNATVVINTIIPPGGNYRLSNWFTMVSWLELR